MGVLCPYASLRADVRMEAIQGYFTLFQKLNNGNGMQRYILIANIKMSLKTQLLCVFRLFLLGKSSYNLWISRILQIADVRYASLQLH